MHRRSLTLSSDQILMAPTRLRTATALIGIGFWMLAILSSTSVDSRQVVASEPTVADAGTGEAAALLEFNREIRPILSEHCFQCHGPDRATREAGLRLDLQESAVAVIEPGDAEASELVRRILSDDPDEQMPPPNVKKEPLSPEHRALLVRWIEQGAEYQTHWALVPPAVKFPPAVKVPFAAENASVVESAAAWVRNPIDNFVMARLQQRGLTASPAADRLTLLRRVTLDLTGLPPTPEEADAFLADTSPGSYQRLIDRLMLSHRYGERMALPWLEAARYADTDGYQNDRYRYMHRWRDWVIMAFNENMPYDQFVIEQLAGDLLPDATLRQQIATGFCRNHRINSEDGSIPEEWRVENVVDRVDTVGTVFLGMTVGCARCHDHKYDPISQKEYYQLFAYFNNVAEWGIGPNNGNSPPFIEVPENWPYLEAEQDRAVAVEPLQLRRARETAGNGLQRPQPGSPSTAMVMHELPEPRETFVLLRGQYNMPDRSERLEAAVPAALAIADLPAPRNRLELAQWLTHPDHPLTARVAVNRLWQQFFGAGLVRTSDNFGSQGELPSHPELLDWLAVEFVRSGWNLQHIQKLILCSATYRQDSSVTAESIRRDPQNRLLARGPRHRLSGFAIRDSALAASGLLTPRIGGPSVKPYMPPKIWEAFSNNKYEQDHGESLFRRSLYTYWRRTIPPPTMMNFNAAAREVCTVRVEQTNTPLQALTLMNNQLFVEAARFLAERMMSETGAAVESQIAHGFRLACGRPPSPAEVEVLRRAHDQFLAQYSEESEAAVAVLSVGETPRDAALAVIPHAAMTMTASLILNLDETITKE